MRRLRRTSLDASAALAERVREVTAQRDAAIVKASNDGFTLREIGEATQLSHTTIKRLVDRLQPDTGEADMRDEWTQYTGRYTQRPETFDAYVDVWQRVPTARSKFTGWASFSQAANAEPAQHVDRVADAERCMKEGGYHLGPSTKRGARRWCRD